MTPKYEAAVDIATRFGGIDGAHHKQWVIDNMVRALLGPGYNSWVKAYNFGHDGPETFQWDIGIAP